MYVKISIQKKTIKYLKILLNTDLKIMSSYQQNNYVGLKLIVRMSKLFATLFIMFERPT